MTPRLLLAVFALALAVAVPACRCAPPASPLEMLSAQPQVVDFASVRCGERKTLPVGLFNAGGQEVEVTAAAIDPAFGNAADFFLVPPPLPLLIPAGRTVTVDVTYAPAADRRSSARLLVSVRGSDGTLSVLLSGEATCTGFDAGRDAGADGGSPGGDGGHDGGEDGGSQHCATHGCTQPPASVCLSTTTVREYAASGACDAQTGACTYPFSDRSCAFGCDAVSNTCAACTPKTCAQLGKNCGTVDDGCGTPLNCGTCTSPQTCGGGGTANVCGAPVCTKPCTSWTQCTDPGEGCDTAIGCCVPCGASGDPCCVDFVQGRFFCGDGGTSTVCGRSSGSGSTVGYYCCPNAGDGCCQQGGCKSNGTCCKCPQNGLNFCVQPSFGCGGC